MQNIIKMKTKPTIFCKNEISNYNISGLEGFLFLHKGRLGEQYKFEFSLESTCCLLVNYFLNVDYHKNMSSRYNILYVAGKFSLFKPRLKAQ